MEIAEGNFRVNHSPVVPWDSHLEEDSYQRAQCRTKAVPAFGSQSCQRHKIKKPESQEISVHTA